MKTKSKNFTLLSIYKLAKKKQKNGRMQKETNKKRNKKEYENEPTPFQPSQQKRKPKQNNITLRVAYGSERRRIL